MNLTPEQCRRRDEARARLDQEVKELKAKHDAGTKLPPPSMDEKIAERNASMNVVCIADVMDEAMHRFAEKEKMPMRIIVARTALRNMGLVYYY